MTIDQATYTCHCTTCGHRWTTTVPASTVIPPRCPCGSWLVSYRRGR